MLISVADAIARDVDGQLIRHVLGDRVGPARHAAGISPWVVLERFL